MTFTERVSLGQQQNAAPKTDVANAQNQSDAIDGDIIESSAEPGAWDSLVAALPEPFASALTLGGPVTLILACMSILALAIIFYKSVQLTLERSRGRRRVNKAIQLWHQGEQQAAIRLINESKKGVAKLVSVAMQGQASSHAPESLVREEVQRLADIGLSLIHI